MRDQAAPVLPAPAAPPAPCCVCCPFSCKGGWCIWDRLLTCDTGLYTDESPGLKVDPVVVLVLSLVFIFSVVALHSTSIFVLTSAKTDT